MTWCHLRLPGSALARARARTSLRPGQRAEPRAERGAGRARGGRSAGREGARASSPASAAAAFARNLGTDLGIDRLAHGRSALAEWTRPASGGSGFAEHGLSRPLAAAILGSDGLGE